MGTIIVEANDVAVITFDFRDISYNLTYGEHYQISVYVDCKPCPTRYRCNYELDVPTSDEFPTLKDQQEQFDKCLSRYNLTSCVLPNGEPELCSNSTIRERGTFQQPDLWKCQRIPFFCDDQLNPKSADGIAADKEIQEASGYIIDPVWQEEVNSINDPAESDLYYEKIPGCCQCERYILPCYFQEDEFIDLGQKDNKHNFVQLSFLAVERSELTVVIELLHGQYYAALTRQFLTQVIFLFTLRVVLTSHQVILLGLLL